jgi:hypothetical protein
LIYEKTRGRKSRETVSLNSCANGQTLTKNTIDLPLLLEISTFSNNSPILKTEIGILVRCHILNLKISLKEQS